MVLDLVRQVRDDLQLILKELPRCTRRKTRLHEINPEGSAIPVPGDNGKPPRPFLLIGTRDRICGLLERNWLKSHRKADRVTGHSGGIEDLYGTHEFVSLESHLVAPKFLAVVVVGSAFRKGILGPTAVKAK